MSFPKIVCDGPNTFSIGSKIDSHILYLLVQTFCAGTNIFGAALNAIQFLVWQKKFGPSQNILGHVKGQDIFVVL